MGDYKYKCPTELGYKQIKLTKKQHNRIFTNRQLKWNQKYEYYYNNKSVRLDKFHDWKAILLTTIFFPVILLFEGLSNYKEITEEFKEMWNQKKCGSFSSEHYWKGKPIYDQVQMLVIGCKVEFIDK